MKEAKLNLPDLELTHDRYTVKWAYDIGDNKGHIIINYQKKESDRIQSLTAPLSSGDLEEVFRWCREKLFGVPSGSHADLTNSDFLRRIADLGHVAGADAARCRAIAAILDDLSNRPVEEIHSPEFDPDEPVFGPDELVMDYKDHPMSIGEHRSNDDRNAALWRPRDLLISYLRDIDEGNIKPDCMFVCYTTINDGKKGVSFTGWGTSSPNVQMTLGTIEMAKFRMLHSTT
jgi:hypothetical protein